MPKITKRALDALRPSVDGREVFLWDAGDGSLKGFGVRMKPSGVASYLVQYRNKEGRTRRLALGKVGTLAPDEARKLAGNTLSDVAKGRDPSADRHAIRGAMTVSELCDLYLVEAKARIKASTLAADISRIETHVKPLIGRFTVRSLTAADIERMKADIIAGKTAKPRRRVGRGGVAAGGSGVAARTLGMTGNHPRIRQKIAQLDQGEPGSWCEEAAGSQTATVPHDRRDHKTGTCYPHNREGGRKRGSLGSDPAIVVDWFAPHGVPRASARLGGRPRGLHPLRGYQERPSTPPSRQGGYQAYRSSAYAG